jgi:MoxR-like ATPase
VPGLGKTLTLSTVARSVDCAFARVSFTPDLLPSDILGGQIYRQNSGTFETKKGPIFTNFLLADEINRAPAKVQSALLEAMQERKVTIAETTYRLDEPFIVLATQNPIEQDGTYALPEAQQDRFLFKTVVDYPTKDEEIGIMRGAAGFPEIRPVLSRESLLSTQAFIRDTVFVHEAMYGYVADLVRATRFGTEGRLAAIRPYVHLGASPRASIAFVQAARVLAFLEGRDYVIPEDIKELAPDILRHRVHRSFDALSEGVSVEAIIASILDTVIVP